MSPGIQCPACGRVNPMGRLFCVSCGAQLDASRIVATREESRASRWRLIRLFVLSLFTFALVAMVWPVPLDGHLGSLDDANRLVARLNRLNNVSQIGEAATETASEAEVNAYIAGHRSATAPDRLTDAILRAEQETFRVRFRPGLALIQWTRAIGPLGISYQLQGTVTRAEGKWRWTTQGVAIGKMPLPSFIAQPVAARVLKSLEVLQQERRLLESAESIELGDRIIHVVMQPKGQRRPERSP